MASSHASVTSEGSALVASCAGKRAGEGLSLRGAWEGVEDGEGRGYDPVPWPGPAGRGPRRGHEGTQPPHVGLDPLHVVS